MSQILQVAAIALATLGTGAATMTVMAPDVADLAVPDGDWTPGTVLDNRSFNITAVDLDSGRELSDTLIFKDGTFQSVNCQTYCDFGWTAYESKTIDGVVHFTATTTCPEAPHTVVWYGTVDGDGMEVSGTWTTRRWYWTHQIRFEGDGVNTSANDSVSG